jgi:hypothetical protein
MDSRIEIEHSKGKIVAFLLGAIVFIALGWVFMINPDAFISSASKNAIYIRVIGVITIVFFGLCLIFIVRKLFDKNPGLVIDKDGITDNSNATSVGLVEWKDITGMEIRQIKSTRFLVLHTSNPEKYITRVQNPILRQGVVFNYSTYGSPIAIISTSLKISFDDLVRLISTELENRTIYE